MNDERLEDIKARRESAAKVIAEGSWLRANVPTWADIDCLLSLVGTRADSVDTERLKEIRENDRRRFLNSHVMPMSDEGREVRYLLSLIPVTAPLLTEEESQLVIGAIPLQALPVTAPPAQEVEVPAEKLLPCPS